MLIGYARTSTEEQRLDRQLDALMDAGVDSRNVYQEKVSGTRRDRPELNRMLAGLQAGDTVVIADLTRISRSTRDLLEIVAQIRGKGAAIRSIKDTWLDTPADNPYSAFLLTVMAGISQLERDLTAQRTKEGLKAAKARGRVGGRPSKINRYGDQIRAMAAGGIKTKDICAATGLSRSTVQRVLRN